MLSTMNTIQCPYCKKTVEISEALKHQFNAEEREKIESEFTKKLEAVKKEAIDGSTKRLKEQFELQMKEAKEDANEKDSRIKKMLEQMTDLTQELRKSKQERDEVKLEMQKQLVEIGRA